MAKALNKSRIRDTKIVLILCFALVIFTNQIIHFDTPLHAAFDMLGNVLVSLCVMGRIYSTAFLGGHKNAVLVDYGPFSVTRNPLYFCSFIGACGIALMSGHILLMLLIPALFCIVFFNVIQREEIFLREEFGASYAAYCEKTPRFFPQFSLYTAPETVPLVPKFLLKSMTDAVLWLLALPFFELVEWLQDAGVIHAFFTLY
jgi:protein-S-isoprenylcysteine O-methyltransferase Ste14